jgi:hypothetical protein
LSRVRHLPAAPAAALAEHPPDQAGDSHLGIRVGAGLDRQCVRSPWHDIVGPQTRYATPWLPARAICGAAPGPYLQDQPARAPPVMSIASLLLLLLPVTPPPGKRIAGFGGASLEASKVSGEGQRRSRMTHLVTGAGPRRTGARPASAKARPTNASAQLTSGRARPTDGRPSPMSANGRPTNARDS